MPRVCSSDGPATHTCAPVSATAEALRSFLPSPRDTVTSVVGWGVLWASAAVTALDTSDKRAAGAACLLAEAEVPLLFLQHFLKCPNLLQ